MARGFDYFVILADMRTGSNLLEASLNAYPGITCHGEVFNPRFIGHAGQERLFDTSIDDREKDPLLMIERIRGNTEGLAGFRLFPDHDPRVFEACLKDRRCAKVVLARNPLDSYVSLKIARRTGQWWLGDATAARAAKAEFVEHEFEEFLDRIGTFYGTIRYALQSSGQTAFNIHYDDLLDDGILDGLARFLGSSGPADQDARKGRVQNPGELADKVENFEAIAPALGKLDPFGIHRMPDFEPRRSANIPTWILAPSARLAFLPIPGGPSEGIRAWLEGLEAEGGVITGLTQRELRQWKRKTPGHRSFTVISHPVVRAHRAFEEHVLADGPNAFHEIRHVLRQRYKLPLPEAGRETVPDLSAHRDLFLSFLGFLKANLSGQTSVRVPAVWASQHKIIQGFGEFAPPDAVIREDRLGEELSRLAALVGVTLPGSADPEDAVSPLLSAIYDPAIEAAARAAYQRDYMLFGFGPWR